MDAVVVDIRTGSPVRRLVLTELPPAPEGPHAGLARSLVLGVVADQLEAAARLLRRMAGERK